MFKLINVSRWNHQSSTPWCATIPGCQLCISSFPQGWKVPIEGHDEYSHCMTMPTGSLCFQTWNNCFFQVLLVLKIIFAICSRHSEVIQCWKSRFLWKKLMEEEDEEPFNNLGLGGLAEYQMASFLLVHRERNPSLSLDHWFWCSLAQLCSYSRSYGTPGFFHSGNLEVESRAHRGSVFKNIATQGGCTLLKTLGQCVSKLRQRRLYITRYKCFTKIDFPTLHYLPWRSYTPSNPAKFDF